MTTLQTTDHWPTPEMWNAFESAAKERISFTLFEKGFLSALAAAPKPPSIEPCPHQDLEGKGFSLEKGEPPNHIVDANKKVEPVAFRMRHHLETDERDWTVLDIRFLERNKHPAYVYELLYTNPDPPSELAKAADKLLSAIEYYKSNVPEEFVENLRAALKNK